MDIVACGIVDREGAEVVGLADIEISTGVGEDGVEGELEMDGGGEFDAEFEIGDGG